MSYSLFTTDFRNNKDIANKYQNVDKSNQLEKRQIFVELFSEEDIL